MPKRISTDERSISDAGNSRRISIPKDWLEILGLEDEDEVVTAILHGKHGFFFGAWKKGEQPDLEDIESQEELEEEIE